MIVILKVKAKDLIEFQLTRAGEFKKTYIVIEETHSSGENILKEFNVESFFIHKRSTEKKTLVVAKDEECVGEYRCPSVFMGTKKECVEMFEKINLAIKEGIGKKQPIYVDLTTPECPKVNKKNPDKELNKIFNTLFNEFTKGLSEGKKYLFNPTKIKIKEKDISFKKEEKEVSEEEAIRLFGTTFYHLIKGESEWTDMSYHVEGYEELLNHPLGKTVSLLLEGEIKNKKILT